MQFLFPTFLFAAAVLAIPIIIHLFYFRKFKKVYFTNVKFLKELKEETSSRSKLRNLLVLLMRLLAFLFLVFAFAQPFLSKNEEVDERDRAVAIYLDNSFSMMSSEQDVPLLDRARQKALQVVNGFGEADRFLLLTNDLLPRHQRWVDKNTMQGFIDEVTLSPAVQPLSLIMSRFQQSTQQVSESKISTFIISDFQKEITDLEDTYDFDMTLVPMGTVQERNLSIDSCWFESPVLLKGQSARIFVRVRNYDDNPAENIRLSLQYEGEMKPIGSLNVPANGTVTDTVSILISSSGWQEFMLEITDYPIQFDDRYYLAVEVPDKMKVLAIYDRAPSRYLEAAFGAIPEYELTQQSANNVDYSLLSSNRLVILNGITEISSGLSAQLTQVIESGSNLMVFPAAEASVASLNALLRTVNIPSLGTYEKGDFQSAYINSNAFVFTDVFERIPDNLKLPSTQGRYRLSNSGAETLIRFRDGRNMMEVHATEGGFVYLSAAPLDRDVSTIIANAEVFVPLLHRSVLHAVASKRTSFIVGIDEQIELELPDLRGDVSYSVEGPVRFLPGITNLGNRAVVSVFNQINKDGWYHLEAQQEETAAILAYNYNRLESNPEKIDAAALTELYPNHTVVDQVAAANLTDFISVQDRGTILWRICLILALIFLLAEVLILRFWKV